MNREQILQIKKNRYYRRKKSKLCTQCGNPSRPGKLVCLDCAKKLKIYHRKWRLHHKKLGLCQMSGCYNSAQKSHCEKHILEKQKRFILKIKEVKIECLNSYGGVRCACCGETELATLCLDHVNNDGGEHRKILGLTGYKFYSYLKRLGYPDKDRYQVLCANCNLYKLIKGSPCYHKIKSNLVGPMEMVLQ